MKELNRKQFQELTQKEQREYLYEVCKENSCEEMGKRLFIVESIPVEVCVSMGLILDKISSSCEI